MQTNTPSLPLSVWVLTVSCQAAGDGQGAVQEQEAGLPADPPAHASFQDPAAAPVPLLLLRQDGERQEHRLGEILFFFLSFWMRQ